MKIVELLLHESDIYDVQGVAFMLDDGTRLVVPDQIFSTLKRRLGRIPDDYWEKRYKQEIASK